MKFGKKGLTGGGLTELLLWIVFIIAAGIAVYFLVNQVFG